MSSFWGITFCLLHNHLGSFFYYPLEYCPEHRIHTWIPFLQGTEALAFHNNKICLARPVSLHTPKRLFSSLFYYSHFCPFAIKNYVFKQTFHKQFSPYFLVSSYICLSFPLGHHMLSSFSADKSSFISFCLYLNWLWTEVWESRGMCIVSFLPSFLPSSIPSLS